MDVKIEKEIISKLSVNDLETLIKSWNQIKDTALNSIAPALIHEESEIINRTLRDMYDENTKNIVIEGNDG